MMNRSRFEDSMYGYHNNSMSMTGGGGAGGGTLQGSFYHHNANASLNYGSPNVTQQSGIEPMHYSPIGGASPPGAVAGGDRVQYLPSFLLGEPSKSPKSKLRKDVMTPNLDLSNLNTSHASFMDRAGQAGPMTPNYSGFQSPATPPVSNLFNNSVSGKTGLPGPPSTSTPSGPIQKGGPPKHGMGAGSSGITTTPTKSNAGEGNHGNWITVFGFQPSNQTFVLQTFSTLGSIIEYKANPGCNWIHIRYSSTVEARKALSKNGSIIGGNMMIGVMKYNPQINHPDPGAPLSSSSTITSPEKGDSLQKNRIRPLASDNLVNQIPVRESGILSKVTELFGW